MTQCTFVDLTSGEATIVWRDAEPVTVLLQVLAGRWSWASGLSAAQLAATGCVCPACIEGGRAGPGQGHRK